MKNLVLALFVVSLGAVASAQVKTQPALVAQDPAVSIVAKGNDVTSILTDICSQAKKQYVIQPDLHFALFMTLKDVPFEKALDIVCHTAHLQVDDRDGILFIHRRTHAQSAVALPSVQPIATVPVADVKPVKLDRKVLSHRLTVRIKKQDLRTVFNEFGAAAGVKIETAPDLPNLKLDAYMIKTSLKYALDKVTRATGLSYEFTTHGTILVSKA